MRVPASTDCTRNAYHYGTLVKNKLASTDSLLVIKIGLIGKTNTGKTTFFNSATLGTGEISNYPFTTQQPSIGNA